MLVWLISFLVQVKSRDLFTCSDTFCDESWIGDGYCDMYCMNPLCNFDSPVYTDTYIDTFYSSDCFSDCECTEAQLTNNVCDAECNSYVCGWDLGKCGYCSDGCTEAMLKNEICDNKCSNLQCLYDNDLCGWCNEGCFNSDLSSSTCKTECDSYYCYYSSSNPCLNSGCSDGCTKNMIGNKECDTNCNNKECEYDGGDCDCITGCGIEEMSQTTCLDDDPCAVSKCSYKNGLCGYCAKGCFYENLGNGVCESACNNENCNYDYGDCGCASGCNYKYDSETGEFSDENNSDGCSTSCLVSSCFFAVDFCDVDNTVIQAVLNYVTYQNKSRLLDESECNCDSKSDYLSDPDTFSCSESTGDNDCTNKNCFYCMGSTDKNDESCVRSSFDSCLICGTSMLQASCQSKMTECPAGHKDVSSLATLFGIDTWCLPEPIIYSPQNYKEVYVDSTTENTDLNGDVDSPYDSIYSAFIDVYASFTKIFIKSKENELFVDYATSELVSDKYDPLNTKSFETFYELWIVGDPDDGSMVDVYVKAKIIITPLAQKVFIQNIRFIGTKIMKVECEDENCAYCPYVDIYSSAYYNDRQEKIEESEYLSYSTNCSAYSNYNYFVFSTNVTISDVEFYNFRSQYNSFIKSSGILTLNRVDFNKMQAKASGSIILITCTSSDCINTVFTYDSGTVEQLGAGYEDSENVGTGSFIKASGAGSISLKNIDFFYNFMQNNLKSVNQGYIVYSLNHLGTIEISDCYFENNYVNYLIYIDVASLEYSDMRIVYSTSQAYAQQHFSMRNLKIENLYCSKGLFYYSMLKVLHNIYFYNVSVYDSVFGEDGIFYLNYLGTLSTSEEEGEYQNKIISGEKTSFYVPARYLFMIDVIVNSCISGGHVFYIGTYSNCYIQNLVFNGIYDGSVDDINTIIENFNSHGEYLSMIDYTNEVPDLNCNDLISVSGIYKLYMTSVTVNDTSCFEESASPGIVLSSISYLELNKTLLSNIESSSSNGIALDIKSSTDIFIKDLKLDNIVNYEYSVVQFDTVDSVTISELTANLLTTNYSSPFAISRVKSFIMSDFKFTNSTTEFSNGGCLFVLTSPSGSTVKMQHGIFKYCEGSSGKGGGIYLDGMSTKANCQFYLNNLTFSGCYADEGAAIYISSMNTFKASFSNEIKDVEIINCISEQGGIIADYHYDGLLYFNGLILDGNEGNNAGYMAFYPSSLPKLKIENAQFLNSKSYDSVLSFKSLKSDTEVELKSVKIIDANNDVSSIFTSKIDLTADSLTVMNVGTGIELTSYSYMYSSNLYIYNCYLYGVQASYNSYFECENSLFEKNNYYVLYIDEESEVYIDTSTFQDNSIDYLPLFSFTSCKDQNSSISNSVITGNSVYGSSLFIVSESNLDLFNVDIYSNTITDNDYSGIYVFKSTLNVNQSSFSDMSATEEGSFIYAVTVSTVYLYGSSFQYGSSLSGNIYIKECTLVIESCTFNNNFGGDLNVELSDLTITDSLFNNSILGSKDNWGSLILTENTDVNIKNCSFLTPSQEKSKSMQSLVYMTKCKSLILKDSIFQGSSATSMGLYIEESNKIVIKDSLFEKFNSDSYSALTAISSVKGLTLTISDSVFQDNNSGDNGGGIYVDSYNFTLTDCEVLNNFADGSGGGVFYETGKCGTCGIYLFGKTKIIGNSCNLDGAGIKWADFKPYYDENEVVIINNTAAQGYDLATIPAKLAFDSARFLVASYKDSEEIAPGQEFTDEILIYLRDTYNQTVLTDSSTQLTISVNNSDQDFSVSGETTFTAKEGIIILTNFTPAGPPGETLILKLESTIKASKVRNDDTIYENLAYLQISFRDCKAGEEIETAACKKCASGKYLLKAAKSCKSCPSGATCKGGDSLIVDNGYWRSDNSSEIVYQCEFSSACIGGTDDEPLGYCAVGYAGVKCQSCEVGYSMNSDYKCAKCPSRAANISILIALLFGIIFFAVVLVKTTLKSAFTPKAMHSIYIKIFTNYLQLVFITTQFNLQWPSYVKQLFNIQQGAATVSDQVFSVDCYLDENNSNDRSQGYYFKICMMSALPFVIFMISYIYWIFYYFIYDNLKPLKREVYTTIIVLFFLIYPNIVKLLFSHFNCMNIDKMDSYLKSNTDITCWRETHNKYSYTVVIPGIILWAVGFPFMLVMIMAKNRRYLHLDIFRVIFGYLFNGYKQSRFFWEFIIMYRKIILISISVFLSSQAVILQALTVVIVLVVSLYVQYAFRPYNSDELNHMETEALFTATITIYCGLYYLSDKIGEELKMILFIVIVGGNAYFIVYWIYYMMQALFDMFVKIFPQFKGKFRRGDAFEENFSEEVLVREGIFHNSQEGRKTYTFLNNSGEWVKSELKYFSMNQAFNNVFKEEIDNFMEGRGPN